jgi:hypothetical protein
MHVGVGYTSVNGDALAKMDVMIGSIDTPLLINISQSPHVHSYSHIMIPADFIPRGLHVPNVSTVRHECSSVTGREERRAVGI